MHVFPRLALARYGRACVDGAKGSRAVGGRHLWSRLHAVRVGRHGGHGSTRLPAVDLRPVAPSGPGGFTAPGRYAPRPSSGWSRGERRPGPGVRSPAARGHPGTQCFGIRAALVCTCQAGCAGPYPLRQAEPPHRVLTGRASALGRRARSSPCSRAAGEACRPGPRARAPSRVANPQPHRGVRDGRRDRSREACRVGFRRSGRRATRRAAAVRSPPHCATPSQPGSDRRKGASRRRIGARRLAEALRTQSSPL